MTKNTEQDVAFIQALADMLKVSDLTEVEVEREYGDDDTLKVRLSRAVTVAAPVAAQVAAPVSAPPAAASAPMAAPASAVESAGTGPAGPDLSNAISSPMVGTVYLASEPGQPNFVSPGDMVEEGQTILIIEAMKTMNQIPAPRSGKVRTILIDNGEPVEFGEPLMIIE
ncbi:MAG: acetyl-CoA carboxylase biotin carboxyl carrier protein [Paracoccaceae bacterium]